MRVTYKMIDRQLRFRGFLLDRLITKSSEEKYIRFLHTIKRRTQKRKGRGVEGLQISEEWIPREDGSMLRIVIYKPLHFKKEVPGVLWLHGGGYALGFPELFQDTYKRLMEASDCVVVAPDYRLSIEAPYPAALEDAYDALLWMRGHSAALGIRSNQLMVGGESAGGGLTAAVALYAREKGDVSIACQMPLYPMIDDRMKTESAKDNNAPIWNTRTNGWAWKLYLGALHEQDVPVYAAPARATDCRNLPPAITFVGDLDPFRDETMQYVEKLRKAGVHVDFELFEGGYHGFEMIHSKAEISRKAIAFFTRSFRRAVEECFAEQK